MKGLIAFPPCPAPAEPRHRKRRSHHTPQSKASADSCRGEKRKSGAWASALCCDEAEPFPEVPRKLSVLPGRASSPGHRWGTEGSQLLTKNLCEHCESRNTQGLQCCKQYASYPTETFLNPLFQVKHIRSQAPYKYINPWQLWEGNNRVIVSNAWAVPFCNIILPLANII